MSPEEFSSKDIFEETQDVLELLKEPKLMSVLKKAEEANEFCSLVPQTPQERARAVTALDALWKPWMHQPMQASGRARYITSAGTIEDAILWNTQIISNGFNTEPTIQNNERVLSSIVLDIRIPHSSVPNGKQSSDGFVQGFADLNMLDLDTKKASRRRAINWLSVMAPGFITAVDERVVSESSVEQQLKNLSDLEVSSYIDIQDELARNCVVKYLDSQVLLDKKLPYIVYVDGPLLHKGLGTGRSVVIPPTQLYVLVDKPKFSLSPPLVPGQVSQSWSIGLTVRAHPEDHRDSTVRYQIPLSSIRAMRSDRKAFYSLVKPT